MQKWNQVTDEKLAKKGPDTINKIKVAQLKKADILENQRKSCEVKIKKWDNFRVQRQNVIKEYIELKTKQQILLKIAKSVIMARKVKQIAGIYFKHLKIRYYENERKRAAKFIVEQIRVFYKKKFGRALGHSKSHRDRLRLRK